MTGRPLTAVGNILLPSPRRRARLQPGGSRAAGRERARSPEPGQGVLPRGARSLLSATSEEGWS